MSTLQKRRLDYIDATKGVAILCITFLHFEQGVIPGWLNTWIGLFMITAFYVTSGWISGISNKSTTPKELFKKRIKQLGVPYLWFSILIIAFEFLWASLGQMDFEILLRDIYKTLTLRGIGTLWFLPVLVVGEYIFCCIRNSKHKLVIAVLTFCVSLFIIHIYDTYWGPTRNINNINKLIDAPMQFIIKGIRAWPIIAIGYFMGKKWGRCILEVKKIWLFSISALLFAISFILIFKPPFSLFYINGVLSNTLPAIAFMCLFVVFEKKIIARFFTYWGTNSLILMCTHFSITQVLLMSFDKNIMHHVAFEGTSTIVYFIITVMLTYPLVYIFNNKLEFMIGK